MAAGQRTILEDGHHVIVHRHYAKHRLYIVASKRFFIITSQLDKVLLPYCARILYSEVPR